MVVGQHRLDGEMSATGAFAKCARHNMALLKLEINSMDTEMSVTKWRFCQTWPHKMVLSLLDMYP